MKESFKMTKKTIIVTGANSGLGFECAKNIAASDKDNFVVLACRNAIRGTEAVASLIKITGNQNISYLPLDLALLASVRNFVTPFSKANYPPLYALICNAGVIFVDKTHFTTDGFEATFATNHLGHFLLANLLVAKMREDGRILFVSSGTHDPAVKTGIAVPVYETAELLAHPQTNDKAKNKSIKIGQQRYTTSKLCNIYCTYALAEKLMHQTNTHITVNAFDPGEMPGTDFSRTFPLPAKLFVKHILPLLKKFQKTAPSARKSGKNLAALVLEPKYSGITNKFYRGTTVVASSELSYNEANKKDLWATSVRLTQLTSAELFF